MKKILLIIILVVIAVAVTFFINKNTVSQQSFVVELTNSSIVNETLSENGVILSHGVIVVHDEKVNLSYENQISPDYFELLAEVGNPDQLIEELREKEGVLDVVKTDVLFPGESAEYVVSANPNSNPRMSILSMVVQSNDTLAVFAGYRLFSEDDILINFNHSAEFFDNGTENNEEPGSGFEGGQPDPARGEDNIDNGEATEPRSVVRRSEQFSNSALTVRTYYPQDN